MFATIEVDGAELSFDPPSNTNSDRGASESSESTTLFVTDNNSGKKVPRSLMFGGKGPSRSAIRLDSGYRSGGKKNIDTKTRSGHDGTKVTFSDDLILRNEYKKTNCASDKKRRRKNRIRGGELEGRRSRTREEDFNFSFEGSLADIGCVENLAKTPSMSAAVMERVPFNGNYLEPRFNDEEDHKSQVDRLIERGTLMYMDGENSGLSSEGESDDDDSDFDSESDITDVSPLISSTSSPIGPSPVLSRKTVPTSPLALYSNSEFSSIFKSQSHSLDISNNENQLENDKSINMDLLLRAVIELENKKSPENGGTSQDHDALSNRGKRAYSSPAAPIPATSSYVHPVRDNPHHLHLRKMHSRRKNMSFSNEEVRKIDRENRILLKKILDAHHRSSSTSSSSSPSSLSRLSYAHHKLSSHSSTNRKREEDKIRRENMILLRKIQDAKACKDISDPLYSSSSIHKSSLSRPVRTPTSGSCGASMLSLNSSSTGLPHVAMPPSRKETAL